MVYDIIIFDGGALRYRDRKVRARLRISVIRGLET